MFKSVLFKSLLFTVPGFGLLALVGWWLIVHGDKPAHPLLGMAGAAGIFIGLFLVVWGLIAVPASLETQDSKR